MRKNVHFFCASGSSGYNDHDNVDHDYITSGYLDIDMKNNVYNNSKTSVNSVASSLTSTPLPP
jgi:hypothetical protein